MTKSRKLPRFDQFQLTHLFKGITVIAVVLAIVRVLFGSGLLKASLVIVAGLLVLGTIVFLIGDHELRVENKSRKQLGPAACGLMLVIGGLAYLFFQIVQFGLQLLR